MGIFGRNDKQSQEQTGATVIPHGTHIIGGINTRGTIHIDGKFEGVITMATYVIIGKTGEFYGKIEAENMSVNGYVDGKIDCDEIEILSHGKVRGDLKYNHLTIEPNGLFEGQGKVKNYTLSSRYKHVTESIQGKISHDK
ncbi:MAG: bactofilin family protein [Candidatus Marinarcus sp.]|uniref:bactofilin family protein n=1 Tax=Candidatus Marinarcus sp. TaxID=3100987 RepID=UPI003B00EEC5